MRLPNGEHAVVERAKLVDYCLSRNHARGRHKARVFASALDLTERDADILRDTLLFVARAEDAQPTMRDIYGQRYVIDFTMTVGTKHARVRSTWIIRANEDFPRLTSCFVF
jgi:hypothetical protein